MTSNNIWLSLEDVAVLTGELQETVRRKCKRGEYLSTFTKNGKYKIYSIKLSSLPLQFQDKYFNKNDISDSKYSEAKNYSKQQADKYLELIKLTEGMNYIEIKNFLNSWNILNPNKTVCYTSLYNAKKNFINNGTDALLSKKHQCGRKTVIEQKYFDSDVILVEADLGYTPKVLFSEIHKKLGFDGCGTIHGMFLDIIDRLKASGRLIIIDEAEHLPYKSLELLRRIYDKAQVGILLVGMPRLIMNLKGEKRQYAQLYSRVGISTRLNKLTEEDKKAIITSILPNGKIVYPILAEYCAGNTRVLTKLLNNEIIQLVERFAENKKTSELLFQNSRGNKLGRTAVFYDFKDICTELGLNEKYSVSSWRKTFA